MRQPPQTKKEAALRLLDGEKFSHNDCVLMHMDTSSVYSPFRSVHVATGKVRGMGIYWSQVTEWQPIPEWHESLSPENKRLCWVHDEDPAARKLAIWIHGKGDNGFYGATYESWKFATPVLPEHLEHD